MRGIHYFDLRQGYVIVGLGGIFQPPRYPTSRRQPGVHRLPDELICAVDDENLAGLFATNMIDSLV
jgi:hypothetical protein